MTSRTAHEIVGDPQAFARLVAEKLYPSSHPEARESTDLTSSSAVLLLLCESPEEPGQICLVLNKRSSSVRQPGDLCLPGGGVSSRLDAALSQLLRFPGSPLRTWPLYEQWRREGRNSLVPLLLTTALREGYEEMRLNPFSPQLLGLLPSQGLRVVRGAIHPVAAWLRRPQSFRPNWEVERVVLLPLREFLDPARHGRLKVRYESGDARLQDRLREEFGCLKVDGELLWGLTYRIIELFLSLVLSYSLPPLKARRLHQLTLVEHYFTGTRN